MNLSVEFRTGGVSVVRNLGVPDADKLTFRICSSGPTKATPHPKRWEHTLDLRKLRAEDERLIALYWEEVRASRAAKIAEAATRDR